MTTDPATEPPHQPDRKAACPSCGAAVLTDVAWCSLCYASLTPSLTPSLPSSPAPSSAPEPQTTDHPRAGAPLSDVDAFADRMLAQLAATRDPEPGWTARIPQTSGRKAGFIVGAVVLGSLLLVALMAVVGLFL